MGTKLMLRGTVFANANLPSLLEPNTSFDFTTSTSLDPRIVFSRASIGTRYSDAGALVTEAANVPRFDFDPVTHVARGLMIEPERTNIVKASSDFTIPPWYKLYNGVVVTTGFSAPDGSNNGKKWAADTSSAYNGLSQVGTRAAASSTTSAWMRGDAAMNISLGIGDSRRIVASLTTEWKRYVYTDTNTAPESHNRIIQINANAAGQTWYVWGAQTESGAFATSYIPTTSAAVTRSADVAQVTLPQTSDILVQDRAGGAWITAVPAGPYTLTPRADQRHITRWRSFPAGYAAANAAMAVAY